MDTFLIIVGIICSALHGAAFPLMIIVFGDMTDTFINDGSLQNWWNDEGQEFVYNVTGTNYTLENITEAVGVVTYVYILCSSSKVHLQQSG